MIKMLKPPQISDNKIILGTIYIMVNLSESLYFVSKQMEGLLSFIFTSGEMAREKRYFEVRKAVL